MKAHRFSIAGLMGLVLITALSLAALRSNSVAWAGATFLITSAILTLGVAGAICRKGRERVWWVGFALFGWGYLSLAIWPPDGWDNLPTIRLFSTFRSRPTLIGFNGFDAYGIINIDAASQVGHCLISLLAAVIGGVLVRWLFAEPAVSAGAVDPRPESPTPRTGWRRPAILGSAVFAATAFAALVGLVRAPGTSAAVMVFFTWGLLSLAIAGAVCRRGKRRAACLGAALFGLGPMILIFHDDPETPGWPHVAIDRILNSLRPSLPWIVPVLPSVSDASNAAANARILKVLGERVPMHFPNETPLEEITKYIRSATTTPDGRAIEIYIDPIGMQEAERTITSPVTIDLEAVPLRTCLQLMLAQLGLSYKVKDGMLLISSSNQDGASPFPSTSEDSYLVVGHCLLALFAAMLGASLAPLVSDS